MPSIVSKMQVIIRRDNLPPRLLPALVTFCHEEGYTRAAVVVDARAGRAFAEIGPVMEALQHDGCDLELLYLDADEEALIQRFKETRRPHPLLQESVVQHTPQRTIMDSIEAERDLLEPARARADRVLDTSAMTGAQLREAIYTTYAHGTRPGLLVTVTSFGFKHGLPIDADLVFDVRFLNNPHYVPELKSLDGRDPRVAEFVHNDPRTDAFQAKMTDLVRFALPEYRKEGKAYLNIAIGCTGGQHRSVMLAEELTADLQSNGYHVALQHRDVLEVRSEGEFPSP